MHRNVARFFAVLVVLSSCLAARADLKQYVDDKTIVAFSADLTKADPDVVEKWVRTAMEAAQMIAPAAGEFAIPPAELDQHLGRAKQWLVDAKKSGATTVYYLGPQQMMQSGAFVMVAPIG